MQSNEAAPLSLVARSLVLSAVVLLGACGPNDAAPTAPGAVAYSRPQPSVPLAMTVDDGANQIQSDGLGEYVDGTQGMMVQIDQYGNLQISPNNASSGTPPQRTLRFDYNSPVDPLNTYRPVDSPQWNFKIKSNLVNNGNPRIQDLALNASGCYNVTIAHLVQTISYEDAFNPAALPQSTYAYITRTGVAPDTWTMVTNGPCPLNANVAALSSPDNSKHGGTVLRGYYYQQFSIHLRAL